MEYKGLIGYQLIHNERIKFARRAEGQYSSFTRSLMYPCLDIIVPNNPSQDTALGDHEFKQEVASPLDSEDELDRNEVLIQKVRVEINIVLRF